MNTTDLAPGHNPFGLTNSQVPHETAPTPAAPVMMRDMTLLDWFAGQALVGVLADSSNISSTDKNASFVYTQAEAMLAERNRRAGK